MTTEKITIRTFKEKHAERSFDISTVAQLQSVCLSVVNERFEFGYYNTDEELPKQPDLPRDQVEALVDGDTKLVLQELWDSYDTALKSYQSSIADHDMAKYAIDNGDGAVAVELLDRRKHWEYEGFCDDTLEQVEPVQPPKFIFERRPGDELSDEEKSVAEYLNNNFWQTRFLFASGRNLIFLRWPTQKCIDYNAQRKREKSFNSDVTLIRIIPFNNEPFQEEIVKEWGQVYRFLVMCGMSSPTAENLLHETEANAKYQSGIIKSKN